MTCRLGGDRSILLSYFHIGHIPFAEVRIPNLLLRLTQYTIYCMRIISGLLCGP
jgi:hypothetical protein